MLRPILNSLFIPKSILAYTSPGLRTVLNSFFRSSSRQNWMGSGPRPVLNPNIIIGPRPILGHPINRLKKGTLNPRLWVSNKFANLTRLIILVSTDRGFI